MKIFLARSLEADKNQYLYVRTKLALDGHDVREYEDVKLDQVLDTIKSCDVTVLVERKKLDWQLPVVLGKGLYIQGKYAFENTTAMVYMQKYDSNGNIIEGCFRNIESFDLIKESKDWLRYCNIELNAFDVSFNDLKNNFNCDYEGDLWGDEEEPYKLLAEEPSAKISSFRISNLVKDISELYFKYGIIL
jgi:hypothetical protein